MTQWTTPDKETTMHYYLQAYNEKPDQIVQLKTQPDNVMMIDEADPYLNQLKERIECVNKTLDALNRDIKAYIKDHDCHPTENQIEHFNQKYEMLVSRLNSEHRYDAGPTDLDIYHPENITRTAYEDLLIEMNDSVVDDFVIIKKDNSESYGFFTEHEVYQFICSLEE